VSERYSRQSKIVDQSVIEQQNVAIIGVGAVGKEVLRTLVCNGIPKITIFDFDTVEEHNCVTQGFYESDIGKPKVEAAAADASKLNAKCQITSVNDRWRPNANKYTAAFFCVDSLSMREKLFNYFSTAVSFCTDSRIGGEQIRLLTIHDEESKAHYPTTIGEDKTAFTDGCHIPMIKHSASIAASMCVQQFMSFLSGRALASCDRMFALNSGDLYDLPVGKTNK
jgi:hypothetical protein